MAAIKFKAKTADQEWLVAKSIAEWDTSRVNAFFYGPPGSGKTRFGLTWPNPIFLDTEAGLQTLLSQLDGDADAPYVSITKLNQLYKVSQNPDILQEALAGTKFEGYPYESIIIDTISTPSDWELQAIMQADGRSEPELQDFKSLALRMRPIFSNFRASKYNTLFLAHDYEGGVAIRDKKTGKTKPPAPPGPMLTGQMRKQGPGLADFFMYMRQETIAGIQKYFAYRVEHPDGYPARVRGVEKYLPERVENITYQHLRDALDKLARKE